MTRQIKFDFEDETRLLEGRNILPFDGQALYYGKLFNQAKALYYYDHLLENIDWKKDEVIVYGKHITTKRESAWYANEKYAYTYSKTTRIAKPWTIELLALKKEVERNTRLSDIRASHDVFGRGLQTISKDAINTVLELIDQNSVYRGQEHRKAIVAFQKLKNSFVALQPFTPNMNEDLFISHEFKVDELRTPEQLAPPRHLNLFITFILSVWELIRV